jgi:signal peptidase I
MSFSPRDPSLEPDGPLQDGRPPERAPQPLPVAVLNSDGTDPWPVEPAVASDSQVWRRTRRIGWELVQTLLLAALIFFAVRAVAQNFRVEGSSMEPSLHDGQYLLVNKAVYQTINLKTLSKFIPFIHPGDKPKRFLFQAPHRGEVIVFRFPREPSRDFIKRVIGVPGDTVEVTAGQVFLNGVKVDEPYIADPGKNDYPRTVVPPGNYFVLGDNRNNSYDSRVWGFLPQENIIGKAMVSYWPLDSLGGVGNHGINLGFITVPLP